MEYTKENILDVTSDVIAHGVNCQGVMGAGFAKVLRDKYPQIYTDYKKHIQNIQNDYGQLLGTVSYTVVGKGLTIANCFTQKYFGRDPGRVYCDYGAIKKCLINIIEDRGIYDDEWAAWSVYIHMPKIGCGLAGGDWLTVEAILKKLEDEYFGVSFIIHEV